LGAAARIALAALVFVGLAFVVDLRELLRLAASAAPVWLVASVLAFTVDQALSTFKWRLLLEGLGLRLPFLPLYKTTTKAFFVSFFVPSALTADVYKGVALARTHGSAKSVTSSIVLERLLGIASIVTVGVMALGSLPARMWGVDSATTLAVGGVALVLGLALFLQADRVWARVAPLLPSPLQRVAPHVTDLAAAFSAYRSQRALLAVSFFLSVAIQFSRCTATWMVARALNDPTPFWAFLFLVPCLYMVNMLPFATSRLGLEQGAFVVLFGAVGMPAEVALTVSLLSVLTSLVVALPGGVWLVTDRRAPVREEVYR
jgi:hypothetical protein